LFLFCCLGFPLALSAQYSDNFSDGDYEVNPHWSGDTSAFDVSSGSQLWLNAPAVSSAAVLSTLSSAILNAEWKFRVRMDFNPSSSNFSRVYLLSDQPDLAQPLHGYYVEAGGAHDDVSLYRQDGATRTLIIDGPDGWLNSDPVNVSIRVTRDSAGNWDLLADSSGGANFISAGMVTDTQFVRGYYSGVFCRYTATRSDKFFFDDFDVTGTAAADTVPPVISEMFRIAPDTWMLCFSEAVDEISAGDESLYFVNNGIGAPVSAVRMPQDISKVLLVLPSPVSYGTLYGLSVSQVRDMQMNPLADTTVLFADYSPVAHDVVINEIMADPEPVAGLPPVEYIEIYNRTPFPLSVKNWKLVCGSVTKQLPSFTLLPDSFALLTDAGYIASFAGLPVHGISSFPALTNGGMPLLLKDTAGLIIDSVRYSASWYGDPEKDDGGYSLERINPDDLCGEASNWTVTLSPSGGTPGSRNTVWDTIVRPLEVQPEVTDSMRIRIVFSRKIDTVVFDPAAMIISCGVAPAAFEFSSADTLWLTAALPIPINVLCTLSFIQPVADCSGHLSLPALTEFIRYVPGIFDVVISEIMVDESPPVLLPETEYIELYNRRDFPIRLRGWELNNNGSAFPLPDVTIQPDSFILLVKEEWLPGFPNVPAAGMLSFPFLTNAFGRLLLYYPDSLLIHEVAYSGDWYKHSGKENGGWSLEMIDPDFPCAGEENWRASGDTSGGTPGRTNSLNGAIADSTLPVIIRTGYIAPDTVVLYLSRPVDPSGVSILNVTMEPGTGIPLSATVAEPGWNRILLKLPVPLSGDTVYRIIVPAGLRDCYGNIMLADTVPVALPGELLPSDIIINEALFHPYSGGTDYVEVYNRSGKVLDLQDLFLAEADTAADLVFNLQQAAPGSMLVFPEEYIVLSADQQLVKQYYGTPAPYNFIDMAGYPSYANTAGVIALTTLSQQVIDLFAYSEDMHFALLSSSEGISLERVSADSPSQDRFNWHSAAQAAGWGTPGYRNSQYLPGSTVQQDAFVFDTEIFSPDNDGYQDLLVIRYELDGPGYVATVTVYDDMGRKMATVLNNELLGTGGWFTWDGVDLYGHKASTGIHLVSIELFSPGGHTEQIRKVCVVAARL